MSTETNIILFVVALAAIAGVAWLIWIGRRKRLQERFGPEYERAVDEYGDRNEAEEELRRREERHKKFPIRQLSPAEQIRFAEAWRWDQSNFVDNPEPAVAEAHQLVTELMGARGYPVTDFERQADDLSVDHPRVVEHYRIAYGLYHRYRSGNASTEELRTAMLHYREVFEQLLDRRVDAQPEMQKAQERAI